MKPDTIRLKLLTALTQYDLRESKKRFHNPNALSLYCDALNHSMRLIEAGRTPRQALIGCFCGRLLDVCLKAIGEAKASADEQRGRIAREEV